MWEIWNKMDILTQPDREVPLESEVWRDEGAGSQQRKGGQV